MSKDTLMLVAFGLFVLLLGMRMKQRYVEWKSEKDGSGNVPGTFPERKEGNKRRRVLFVIQLFCAWRIAGLYDPYFGPGFYRP